MLVITDYIHRTEMKAIHKYFSIEDIKKAAKKIFISGIELSRLGYRNCKIIKVRINKDPAGRMIVFFEMDRTYIIPIIIRLKKDKVFGENLSLSNKKAKEKIIQNLDYIFEDLKNNRYIKYEM